jgi:type VI secretion system secreted protein VgrG
MNPAKLVIPLLLTLAFGAAQASTAPSLGSARDFAILGGSTVTNTGATTIQGDLGLWPGTSVTGSSDFVLQGVLHISDTIAQDAQMAAAATYSDLANRMPTVNLSGMDLGTLGPLHSGVYHFDSSAQLTGTLTLDAQNDPNAVFIFQIGSSFTSATGSAVNVLNAGSNTGIFWQVGSSAVLGTSTRFAGNILANQSITFDTSAQILGGRALALNAAVTLDHNNIYSTCGAGVCDDYGSHGYSGGVSAVPEPSTSFMFGFGLLALMAAGFRARAMKTRNDSAL